MSVISVMTKDRPTSYFSVQTSLYKDGRNPSFSLFRRMRFWFRLPIQHPRVASNRAPIARTPTNRVAHAKDQPAEMPVVDDRNDDQRQTHPRQAPSIVMFMTAHDKSPGVYLLLKIAALRVKTLSKCPSIARKLIDAGERALSRAPWSPMRSLMTVLELSSPPSAFDLLFMYSQSLPVVTSKE